MPKPTPSNRPTRAPRNSGSAWSLNLSPEEDKSALNVNVAASIHADIDILVRQYNSTKATIVELCLRQALGSNKELQALKSKPLSTDTAAAPAKA